MDLNGLRVETHCRPVDGHCMDIMVYEGEQLVRPEAFPDIAIPANEVMP